MVSRQKDSIKPPKFEDKQIQSVTYYLDVIERIMEQNEFSQKNWALYLRSAAISTKLEALAELCGAYKDMKREILIAFGKTAEGPWNELMDVRQGENESFRQLCIRIKRNFKEFLSAA